MLRPLTAAGGSALALLFVSTKRAASRRALLGLIFLAVACITAILAGTTGYAQIAATSALRQSVSDSSGAEAFQRLHSSLPAEADARQEQTAAFERLFAEAGIVQSADIYTSIYTPPAGDIPSSGSTADIPADAEFSLTAWQPGGEHLRAVDSELPRPLQAEGSDGGTGTSADDGATADAGGASNDGGTAGGAVPAVVTSESADALNLKTGDTVRLNTEPRVRAEIAAVVEPDRQASLVLNAAATDYENQQVHPLLVPAQYVHTSGSSAKSAWTILPDPDRITAAQLPGLIEGLGLLEEQAVSNEAANAGGVVASGALAETLQTAQSATQAVRDVVPVAMILLVLLSAVALFQLARLLAGNRSDETVLLGARGASPIQHLRMGLFESAPMSLAGAAAGYALAGTITPLLVSASGGAVEWPVAFAGILTATWPVPLLTALTAVVILAGTSLIEGLRQPTSLSRRQTTGRSKASSFGVIVLIAGAAALTLWQFRRSGSAMRSAADGSLTVDPIAVAAPALLILALAAIAVPAIAAVAAVVQRLAAGRRGLVFPLAARQVSRRIGSYAVPIALIAVTVGAGTLTASYAATSNTAQSAAAHLSNGSDVRLGFPGSAAISGPEDLVDLQDFADVDTVTQVSPVIVNEARIGEADVGLAAVVPQALPKLLQGARDVTDAEALSKALAGSAANKAGAERNDGGTRVSLPPGTVQLRLQLSSTSGNVLSDNGAAPGFSGSSDAPVSVQLMGWFEFDDGQLAPVPFGTINLHESTQPQSHSIAVNLPDGRDAASLRAIDFSVSPTSSPLQYTVSIDAISSIDGAGTDRAIEIPGGAEFQRRRDVLSSGTGDIGSPSGGGFIVPPSIGNSAIEGRLMPTPPDGPAQHPVPVVVTDSLLQELDLAVGEELTLQPPGTRIPARITAAVPTLPGIDGSLGAMVDITAFQGAALTTADTLPAVSELWLSSSDTERTAAQLQEMVGSGVEITTADTSYADLFLAPAVRVLWIGTIGALIIGAIALAASIQTLARLRKSEVDVLSALGLSAGAQAAGRRWELTAVGLFAAVAGVAAGWLTSILTAQGLAGPTVLNAPAGMPVPVGISWPGWSAIVLAQVLVLAAACWFYGFIVRRQFNSDEAVEKL